MCVSSIGSVSLGNPNISICLCHNFEKLMIIIFTIQTIDSEFNVITFCDSTKGYGYKFKIDNVFDLSEGNYL